MGQLAWVSMALVACGTSASSKAGGAGSAAEGGVGGGGDVSNTQPEGSSGGPSDGGPGAAAGGSQTNAGGGSSSAGASSAGASGTSPEAAAGAAGAAGPSSGDAGAGGSAAVWSDVVPVRTRVGPQTTPRQLFASELQLGAFWETPSGDVLTSFRTSVTQPQPGVAIDDYHYNLQTIVGAAIQAVPNVDVGTCRYQDPPYGSCSVGPDPDGPSQRSLVADDGAILVVEEQPTAGSTMHPLVERLDPAAGTLSTVVEMADIQMHASSLSYSATLALRQLADGTIALATAMQGDPARTIVFDTAGARHAQRAGFAFGERWQRFAVFLGENAGAYNQRFDCWDPRTDASARAFGFPTASPAPAFRTYVTPPGDVIFPGFTYTDRLVHIDPDGTVVEDRALPSFDFLGALPDGRYLTYEPDAALGYTLRVYDRHGASTVLYDQPTLMRDASWPAIGSGGFYPIMDHMDFAALVDDGGNAYVGFVLQTGGNTMTETYLVAFAPDGQKLWGYKLATTLNGVCQPDAVLSKHRLVVRCAGRYLRRFLILGE